jgi:hypothetical protein
MCQLLQMLFCWEQVTTVYSTLRYHMNVAAGCLMASVVSAGLRCPAAPSRHCAGQMPTTEHAAPVHLLVLQLLPLPLPTHSLA